MGQCVQSSSMVAGGGGLVRSAHFAEVKRAIGARLYNKTMSVAEIWSSFWAMMAGIMLVRIFPQRALWEQIALAVVCIAVASVLLSLT